MEGELIFQTVQFGISNTRDQDLRSAFKMHYTTVAALD